MKTHEGAIYLISSINKEIDFLFSYLLSNLEITKMESVYLKLIYQNPGISQYEISKETKIERSLVTKYITNLEDKGMIEKRKIDSRKKGLYLLKDGILAINYIDSFLPNIQDKFKDLFSENEIEIFLNVLKKFKKQLEIINSKNL
ncbi:MAG: MarR family winged helix-turn-helix transcriptional regulator [Cetobacterium sp.]|uniref:MarR family winged helix-turn-helix transcriptional regulator n=1 Tax=Cetobacterium sp. TaxID=2071632 RepID=UPI003F3F09A2